MEYPEIAIKALINSLNDDDDAYKWLTKSKWKELAALIDILRYDDVQARQFLIRNKHTTITNFLNALRKESEAFDSLMNTHDREWAATVNAVQGDKEAYQWLVKNNFAIYTDLVDALIPYFRRKGPFSWMHW